MDDGKSYFIIPCKKEEVIEVFRMLNERSITCHYGVNLESALKFVQPRRQTVNSSTQTEQKTCSKSTLTLHRSGVNTSSDGVAFVEDRSRNDAPQSDTTMEDDEIIDIPRPEISRPFQAGLKKLLNPAGIGKMCSDSLCKDSSKEVGCSKEISSDGEEELVPSPSLVMLKEKASEMTQLVPGEVTSTEDPPLPTENDHVDVPETTRAHAVLPVPEDSLEVIVFTDDNASANKENSPPHTTQHLAANSTVFKNQIIKEEVENSDGAYIPSLAEMKCVLFPDHFEGSLYPKNDLHDKSSRKAKGGVVPIDAAKCQICSRKGSSFKIKDVVHHCLLHQAKGLFYCSSTRCPFQCLSKKAYDLHNSSSHIGSAKCKRTTVDSSFYKGWRKKAKECFPNLEKEIIELLMNTIKEELAK